MPGASGNPAYLLHRTEGLSRETRCWQGVRKISSKKPDSYDKTDSLSQLIEEELGGRITNKVVLKKFSFATTPELREEFDTAAKELGMNLTEFLRRAGRAAINDTSLLTQPEIDEAEAKYKGSIGPSRWNREPE